MCESLAILKFYKLILTGHVTHEEFLAFSSSQTSTSAQKLNFFKALGLQLFVIMPLFLTYIF